MKKIFHNMYWNLAILAGDAAGETYAFGHAKPPYLVMNELRAFLETPKLILNFIQTIDIGLKQRLMKKPKQKAHYHKINILAEKSTNDILLFYFISIYIFGLKQINSLNKIDSIEMNRQLCLQLPK